MCLKSPAAEGWGGIRWRLAVNPLTRCVANRGAWTPCQILGATLSSDITHIERGSGEGRGHRLGTFAPALRKAECATQPSGWGHGIHNKGRPAGEAAEDKAPQGDATEHRRKTNKSITPLWLLHVLKLSAWIWQAFWSPFCLWSSQLHAATASFAHVSHPSSSMVAAPPLPTPLWAELAPKWL